MNWKRCDDFAYHGLLVIGAALAIGVAGYMLSRVIVPPSVSAQVQPLGNETSPVINNSAPFQRGTLLNTKGTSAANTAITTSIAASPTRRVYLYGIEARCSAGSAVLDVKNGVAGTIMWDTQATAVGTTNFARRWETPLASSTDNGMDITLGACGATNTGVLIVQASRF